MRQTITCDIDGVLTYYPDCWLEYLYDKCGKQYRTVEEARIYESNYSVYKDMYRKSDYKATLPINLINKNAINRLSKNYNIVFVTSRPIHDKKYPNLYNITYSWLKDNGLIFEELRFKDESCSFLDDLDVAFHIDDEIIYANGVAGKHTKVYLLTDSCSFEELDKSIIVVKDISEIVGGPFFSVCIPSTNREKTIYRCLKSVADQKYRNFELVIVDCASDDNTVKEIEAFFSSNEYKDNPFTYTFCKRDYKPNGTDDWNEPVMLATGKYIAMLEGDDYWLPEHLMYAYEAISNNDNVGIFGASNLKNKRHFHGILQNKQAKQYCYIMLDGVVPPSESVFIRCNKDGNPYKYKSDKYNYSPEIALYLDIALDGYDLYYSQNQVVYREPSNDPRKFKTWYYFSNRFAMIEEYKKYFSKMIVLKAKLYNACLVVSFSFDNKSKRLNPDLIKCMFMTVGYPLGVYCIAKVYIAKLFSQHRFKIWRKIEETWK